MSLTPTIPDEMLLFSWRLQILSNIARYIELKGKSDNHDIVTNIITWLISISECQCRYGSTINLLRHIINTRN